MKNLFCLILVFGMVVTGFAQKEAVPYKGDKSEMAVQRMTKELNLTTDQQDKIRALYQQKMQDRAEQKEDTKMDRKAVRTSYEAELAAILTPEQMAKRTELKETRRANIRSSQAKKKVRRKQHAKGKSQLGGMTPEMIEERAQKSTDKLHRQVNLTEAQQASVKQSYLDFFQKNQAIARDEASKPEARKEQFKSLKKSHKEDIQAILTPEQVEAKKAHKMTKKKKGKKGKRKHLKEDQQQ